MLDLGFIEANHEAVRANCRNRSVSADVDLVLRLASERRSLVTGLQSIRERQKQISKETQKAGDAGSRQELVERGRSLKREASALEEELRRLEAQLLPAQREIPNMSHPSSPIGRGEEDNVEVERVGTPPAFNFAPRDHLELGQLLDIIDFESGAKVAGRDFYFLKGAGAVLEIALLQYALGILLKEGFTPYVTPDVATKEVLDGIGFSPRGPESQIYGLEGTDLGLIATAEITLGGMMKDAVLEEEKLPVRICGLSHCFRRESGTYGRASKGLYRVHQFSKLEMFAYTTPGQSEAMHAEFVRIEKKIFSGLGVPFRVVECCTGDLGGAAYRKFDLEAWMPGRGEGGDWGEITSASNCTDYQARRLNIRYKPRSGGRSAFVHTLNGTAVAVSRALIAVLENWQQADGSVIVPEPLRALGDTDVLRPAQSRG